MNCHDCKQKLALQFVDSRAVGVSCPRCEKQWKSERIREIYNHCHDSMVRQITGIVNHMDFDDSCVEVTEKTDA